MIVEIDTASDADPETIKEAVESALSKAVSDGSVGNLKVDPDSVAVMQPQIKETENSK